MRRVTRPGGTVAAAVWDYAGQNDVATAVLGRGDRTRPVRRRLDEGRSMRFCSPDELEALWASAGLSEVSVSPAVVSAGYEGFDDLWEPLELGVGPSGAYVAALPSERRSALKAELRKRLDAGAEPFSLSARAWVVTGRVPKP